MTLTAQQVREARHRLGMTQARLATLTGLAQSHSSRFEQSGRLPQSVYSSSNGLTTLRAALEAAGASFLGENSGSRLDALPTEEVVKLTPAQVRDARQLLGMSQTRLATLASVSQSYVSLYETSRYIGTLTRARDCLAAIRAALEAAGIEFTKGEEPGVKLRKQER